MVCDVTDCQEHIIKMYDNVASVRLVRGFGGEPARVTGLLSTEGEEMTLLSDVSAQGRVEDWMSSVLREMRLANRRITKTAVFYYCADKMTRLEWMKQY